MIPVTYELAKERMAERVRVAERHQLVQQAKAAARDEHMATGRATTTRRRVLSWFRLTSDVAGIPSSWS
jgi:hypothetical protein